MRTTRRLQTLGGHLEAQPTEAQTGPNERQVFQSRDYDTQGNFIEATEDQAKAYPIINPYTTDLDELDVKRQEAMKPGRMYKNAVQSGKIEPPNDGLAYVWLKEKRPNLIKEVFAKRPPPGKQFDNDTVEEILGPVFDRFIDNIQKKTTDQPYDPMVNNANDTFCNPERFEFEKRELETSFLIGTTVGDVLEGRYLETTMNGKKVLLMRDGASGDRFHAYDNTAGAVQVADAASWCCRGDVVALSGDPSRLAELPTGVRCGMVLVLTHPELLDQSQLSEGALTEMLDNVFNADLTRELTAYGIGKSKPIVSQQIEVDGNWKLAIDTFGESYHFQHLHAETLRDTFACNRQVFRAFDNDRDGSPQNSSMVLGRFTMQLLADGDVPPDMRGNIIDHMIPTFVLAYNTVFFPFGNGVFMSQIWPLEHAGRCMTALTNMGTRYPADPKQAVQGFGGILDIFATEDFKILPMMQANFEANPHAQTIFGRHEPALTYRHKMFNEMAAKGAAKMKMQQEYEAVPVAAGGK